MKRFQGSLLSHLALVVILAAVPSLVMLMVTIWQAQVSVQKQTEHDAATTVALLVSDQKALILRTKHYLQRLASFPEIEQPASADCSRFLGKLLALSNAYLNLGIALPDGELVCNALPAAGKLSVADRQFFQQALHSREFALGDLQLDRSAGRTSISFAYPVIEPSSDRLVGVAVAVVSTEWWNQKLAEVDLPDGAVAVVTDSNGRIIAHHPANSHAIGLFAETYGFDSSLVATHAAANVTLKQDDGEQMVYAHGSIFADAGGGQFMVIIGLPLDNALSASRHTFWGGISIILLIVGVTLTLAIWVMRANVIRPINALLRYTQSLERGALTDPPAVRGTREFSTLLAQIVSMGRTRLAVEANLRESEARFRQIAETIPEVFWVVNRDWSRFLYVNPAYENVWQQPINSLYREPDSWIDSILPDDRRQVLESINQMESTQHSNIVLPLFRIERKDGTVRWISVKGFPAYDGDGEVTSIVGIAEDVTETKQYEAELSERESKYRLLVEHAEDLVVKVDNDGRFLFVSPSYCRTFGRSEHQLLGKHFMPLVHEEDQASTAEAMKKLYYPPFAVYLEQRAMTVNGWRWFGWSDKAMLDSSDRVMEIVGVGRDITQQKTAEFALRESEARYRELVDNMSDGVAVYQPAGDGGNFIIQDLNRAAERIVQMRRENGIGRRVTKVFPGVKTLGLLDVLIKVSESGVPARHPIQQYRDNRLMLWVENFVFRLPSGEVVAVFHDATAEKTATDALRNSEEKFRGFFEDLTVGLVIADQHGDIIDVNKAFSDILGIQREAAQGRSLVQLLGEGQDQAVRQRLQTLMQERHEHERFQISFGERSGHPVVANVSIGVIYDEQDNRINIYGVVEDVSTLVETEAARAQLQHELMRTYRLEALGRLAGGIAHDFNNILGAISGFIELAIDRADHVEPSRIRGYLEASLQSAERARQLIRQLLLFSRGPKTHAASPQDFGAVVHDSLRMIRSFLPSSIEIDFSIDGGPYVVACDPVQIEQVILNLCINARDAMQEQGSIRIEVARYSASGDHCEICTDPVEGEWASLSVEDAGSGIPDAVRDKIFEPFFTTKGRVKGTGLGLSVVHGIVSSYEGHILIDSAPGRGTRFTLLFPRLAQSSVETEPLSARRSAVEQSLHRDALHILIVDDEKQIRELFGEALSKQGYRVTLLDNGLEALRLIQESGSCVDLVITDQTMPQMTGIDLIRMLRECGNHVPVILCSGYSELLTDELMEAQDIAHFLNKPVRISELLATVDEVLFRQQAG
jgi:PAS domain S-box-containing protein